MANTQIAPREAAHRAMERMAESGIPPTPENYAVWYGFFIESDQDLVRTVESSLTPAGTMDEAACRQIYSRHFANENTEAAIEAASRRLETSLEAIMSSVNAASENASDYGERLAGLSGDIAQVGSSEDLQHLVHKIMADTREVLDKNAELERQLQESSEEVHALRDRLEEVRKESQTDGLTGIANRKLFDRRIREAIAEAEQSDRPLCLLLTDIDHFKVFNDTFGHRVGDEVLRVVARTLKQQVKGRDTPARYGGEEFAVILPDTTLEDAETLADQIRKAVASKNLRNSRTGQSFGNVTLSIGAALWRRGEGPSAIIERTDAALYSAKHAGRNRVMISGDEEASAALSA